MLEIKEKALTERDVSALGYRILTFDIKGDARGSLLALEAMTQVPFDIQRVFCIYDSQQDVVRGCHANRHTQFVLVAVRGECDVTIRTQDISVNIKLDHPSKGLFLDKMVWKEMHHFSEDCVLLVLCSEKYDPDEYIHDFDLLMQRESA